MNRSYVAYAYVWVPYIPLIPIHIYTYTEYTAKCLSKLPCPSSYHPGKATGHAEANAKWGALHFEIQMLTSPLVRHHIVITITRLTVVLPIMLLPFTLAPHHRTTPRTSARPFLDFLGLILILLLTAGGGGGGGGVGGGGAIGVGIGFRTIDDVGIGVGIGFRTINDVKLLQHRPRCRQR